MAQTVQLALGTTAATSSDIVVATGLEATIGIYAATNTKLRDAGDTFFCAVLQVTPGEPNNVAKLDAAQPSITVAGPNTFRVVRNVAAISVGVFSEA